jgi:peptide/histidine transporter 3/4
MRSGGGGEREDEEAAHKLKSMDVNKLQKGGSSSDEDSPHPPRPAVKYHGWRAMPFIIGTPRELPGSDLSWVFMADRKC